MSKGLKKIYKSHVTKCMIIAICFTLLLTVAQIKTAAVQVSDFTDVSAFIPVYESELNYIVEEVNVMNGTSSSTFSPGNSILRADALVTMCRVFQIDVLPYQSYSIPFTDVPANAYYTNYVKWAYHEGIISGTSATTFSPQDPMERQQICLVFLRVCNNQGITLPDNGDTTFLFTDDNLIESIYKEAVYRLYRAGIITGASGAYFHPSDPMMRIHYCLFLFRYYDPELPNSPYDFLKTSGPNLVACRWLCELGTESEIRINNGDWISPSINQDFPNEGYRFCKRTFSNLNGGTTYTVKVRTIKHLTNTDIYSPIQTVYITAKHKYQLELKNWFDSGYSVGHSESSTTSKNKINSYSQAVSNRYLQLFDLDVTYSTSPFQSSLDTCKGTVTGSNLLSNCTHSTQRHDFSLNKSGENYSTIYSNFTSFVQGSNVKTQAYWTQHRTYWDSDMSDGGINRSFSTSNYHIFLLNHFSSDRDLNSKGVLMHELNHQIGAKDHYHEEMEAGDIKTCKRAVANNGNGICSCQDCNDENGTQFRPGSCIMNNSYQSINNSNILCDACKSDILAHLNSHHISPSSTQQ